MKTTPLTLIAVVAFSHPCHGQAKKDNLDTITAAQRQAVVKAIREKVGIKLKAKKFDEERDAVVKHAQESPWEFTSAIRDPGDPDEKRFGFLYDGTEFTIKKIVKDGQLVFQGRAVAIPQSGRPTFNPGKSKPSAHFLVDYPTDKLKAGDKTDFGAHDRAADAKEKGVATQFQIFYATGQREIEGTKAWRVMPIEFTDAEKGQFDPRTKKQKK